MTNTTHVGVNIPSAKSFPPNATLRFPISDEKLTKIQRYLPGGLSEKILAQRDRIERERRQVTVMFCDLEGFTALMGRLGLEEAYAGMG